MTTPTLATFTDKPSGSRLYKHPITGDACPGVTSVIGGKAKPFLTPWAAKMVATAAVEKRELIAKMIEEVGEDEAIKWLKGAPYRKSGAAADAGTNAHSIFEALLKGNPLGELTEDADLYRRHFADFLDKVQPEMVYAEESIWSETHGYAGTFDAFLKIEGVPTIADWKTSNAVYPETSLQLAAYANADHIIRADGTQVPMPKAERGVVLRVRPDEGWQLHELPIGPDVFEVFLSLRKLWDFTRIERSLVQKPLVVGRGA